MLNLRFQHAIIRYVQNESYQDPMTTIGETVEELKQYVSIYGTDNIVPRSAYHFVDLHHIPDRLPHTYPSQPSRNCGVIQLSVRSPNANPPLDVHLAILAVI